MTANEIDNNNNKLTCKGPKFQALQLDIFGHASASSVQAVEFDGTSDELAQFRLRYGAQFLGVPALVVGEARDRNISIDASD